MRDLHLCDIGHTYDTSPPSLEEQLVTATARIDELEEENDKLKFENYKLAERML